MIRIALCDDEQKILDQASLYIEKYAAVRNRQDLEIFTFDSVRSLKNALDEEMSFDIFVLDIYIGDEIGTDLARSIRKRGIESPIIFLTTSVEHAPESFETGTLRYLIKPINPVKFFEAMDATLAQAEKMGERQVKLKTESGVESVNASRIMLSEANAHYQYVTLENGEQIRVRMTVAEFHATLMKYGGFIRVGSSYIINLRNVKNVTSSALHMYNNISIPIPRGKYTEIRKAFWDFQSDGQED